MQWNGQLHLPLTSVCSAGWDTGIESEFLSLQYDFDTIVIGAGAAGLTAAGMSALLGAKTALIEANRLGGDCTWAGCVPSKTLLKASRVAHTMRTAHRFGLGAITPEIPFSGVMDHLRSVRQHVYQDADAPPNMEKLGVQVVVGCAQFVDPHTVTVQTSAASAGRLTSRYFVIATGSRPKTLPFAEACLTNETIFELESQPRRLVVIGAGPVGVEMAQAFGRLGSEVTVVTPDTRILRRDDADHAQLLQECLRGEGISFRFGCRVEALRRENGDLQAILDDGSALPCDSVLAAMGREPSVAALQLEKAGVAFGKGGVQVNARCQTTQKHIFAAGDVTGQYQFTHMAEHMSKVAVTNAILRWPAKVDKEHVVWSTFTEPELARLGDAETDALPRGADRKVYRFPFDKLDRAITEGETTGEVKVITTRSGRILGASIVGANAGEMISEWALAMRSGLNIGRVAGTIHPYPTYMLGNRRAADKASFKYLDSPLLGVLGRFRKLRGVRKGSAGL